MDLKKLENRFRIDLKKLNRYTDREDLKVVHYTGDGHIEMTNSHVGVRAKNVYEGSEKFKHGKAPEHYPDMNHLFDQYESKNVIENIPIKEFEDIFEPFKSAKPEVIHLNFAPNGIFTEIAGNKERIEVDGVMKNDPNKIQMGSKSGLIIDLNIEKSYQVTLRYDYLLIIIQFMRLLGLTNFNLYYPDGLTTLSFLHENLEIIIAPVRNSSNKVFDGVKKLEKEQLT